MRGSRAGASSLEPALSTAKSAFSCHIAPLSTLGQGSISFVGFKWALRVARLACTRARIGGDFVTLLPPPPRMDDKQHAVKCRSTAE